MTCSQIGLKGRARGYLLDALQEAEMGRSIPGKLRVIRQMANVHLSCKEWDEAEIRLNQAINLVAQIGDRTCESSLLIDLGRLYRIRGDVEQARRRLDKAACKAKVVGWSEGLERITSEIEMLKYAVPSAL